MILLLEQQVTSLELSKKLKELGVKQDSLFYWTPSNAYNKYYISDIGYRLTPIPSENEYSAFTVAELGELLPAIVYSYGNKDCPYYLFEMKGSVELHRYLEEEGYFIGYGDIWHDHDLWDVIAFRTHEIAIESQQDKNQTNNRAKMLIYLIENKLMELSE